MNYYKRHIGDYAAKTGHLSALEHGVYNLLIDAYYNREVAPTRAEAMRWAKARTTAEMAAVQVVLEEFFTEVDGCFRQARIDDELAAYWAKQDVNRGIALAREQAKRDAIAARNEHETSTKRAPSVNLTSNHKPVASNKSKADTHTVTDSDRPAGESVGVFEGHTATALVQQPSAYATAAIALTQAGVRVTSQNPDLIAAVNEGVTPAHLIELVGQYPGKPVKYLITVARRELTERAAELSASGAAASPRRGPSRQAQAIAKALGTHRPEDTDHDLPRLV